jgi:hypothetical protein
MRPSLYLGPIAEGKLKALLPPIDLTNARRKTSENATGIPNAGKKRQSSRACDSRG